MVTHCHHRPFPGEPVSSHSVTYWFGVVMYHYNYQSGTCALPEEEEEELVGIIFRYPVM